MRNIYVLFLLSLMISSLQLSAKNSSIGFRLGGGLTEYSTSNGYYTQEMNTDLFSVYFKFYSPDKNHGHNFVFASRNDEIQFTNIAPFYNTETNSMDVFNGNGKLNRKSLRMGYEHQFLFGERPHKFGLGILIGTFYEVTPKVTRTNEDNEQEFTLYDEVNRHNLGLNMGIEGYLGMFTMSFRFENLFFDILDRKHINSLPLTHNSSAELRGLNFKHGMGVFTIGMQF